MPQINDKSYPFRTKIRMDKPTLIIQNICFKKIFELEHQNLEFVIYNDIIKFSTTPAKQNP